MRAAALIVHARRTDVSARFAELHKLQHLLCARDDLLGQAADEYAAHCVLVNSQRRRLRRNKIADDLIIDFNIRNSDQKFSINK